MFYPSASEGQNLEDCLRDKSRSFHESSVMILSVFPLNQKNFFSSEWFAFRSKELSSTFDPKVPNLSGFGLLQIAIQFVSCEVRRLTLAL